VNQIAQSCKPPSNDDLVCRFNAGAEYALDCADILLANGRVVECDVDFFMLAIPAQEELKIRDMDRTPLLDLVMYGAEELPHLAPHLVAASTQGGWMFCTTKEGEIGVVIDESQFWSEPEDRRDPRIEAEADSGLDASGPAFRVTERR
jgi:hypothetical protein